MPQSAYDEVEHALHTRRDPRASGLPTAARSEAGPDLFGTPPTATVDTSPVARRTDPDTSHEAARRAAKKLTDAQRAVLQAFRIGGRMHDEKLLANYHALRDRYPGTYPPQTPSGLRSRRADLVRLGYLEYAEEDAVTSTGGRTKVWKLTAKGAK